jgi:hypothetical protein
MTPTTTAAAAAAAEGWTSAAVERGLWAGQHDHEFAGLIGQEIEHGYSPIDDTGHALGTFDTLLQAKSALETAAPRTSDVP